MSYDVYVEVPTGPESSYCVFDANYTSNVSAMWTHALDVPERPCYNEDGSPRMGSRHNRDTGEWEPVHIHDFGLRVLHGAPCSEAAGVLARAVQRMESDPEFYRQWNADNGWGDYDGALKFLRSVAEAAAQHSYGVIKVSA